MGVVCPSGTNLDQLKESLWSGEISLRATESQVEGRSFTTWTGRVPAFDPSEWLEPRVIDGTDFGQQFAIAAAEMAKQAAGIHQFDPLRTAIVSGTSFGGVISLQHAQYLFDRYGFDAVPAKTMLRIFGNMAAAQIAMRWDLHGPQITFSHAAAGGIDAVGTAADLVRRGRADVAIALGYDATNGFDHPGLDEHFVPGQLASSFVGQAASPRAMARPWPFDQHRTGSASAEGAACVIVEAADHAAERACQPWAAIEGYASLGEGYDPTSPDPTGRWQTAAMAEAIDRAGVQPSDVDALIAYGAGTRDGDAAEISAINALFGDGRQPIPVTSIKGHMGDPGAASGCLSVVAAAIAITEGSLVHTAGTKEVDDAVRFDLVTGSPRPLSLEKVLVNGFGYGGQDASIVIGRARG